MEAIKTLCFLLALSSSLLPVRGASNEDTSLLQIMLFRWSHNTYNIDGLLSRHLRQADSERVIENVTQHDILPKRQTSPTQTDSISSIIDSVKKIEPAKKLRDNLYVPAGTKGARQTSHQTGSYLNEGKANSASQPNGLYKQRQRVSSAKQASVQVTLIVVAAVLSAVILVGALRRCTRRRDDGEDGERLNTYLQYEMQYRIKHRLLRVRGKKRQRMQKRGRESQNLMMFTIHEHDNEEEDSDQASAVNSPNSNSIHANVRGDVGNHSSVESCADLTTVAFLNNPQVGHHEISTSLMGVPSEQSVASGSRQNVYHVNGSGCRSDTNPSSLEMIERIVSTTSACRTIGRSSTSSSSLSSYTSCAASDEYFGQISVEQEGASRPTDITSHETNSISETIQSETSQRNTSSANCQVLDLSNMASTSNNAEQACASEINNAPSRGVISAIWQSWRALSFNKDWSGARWFNRYQAGLKRSSSHSSAIMNDASAESAKPREQSTNICNGCEEFPPGSNYDTQLGQVPTSDNRDNSENASVPDSIATCPNTSQNFSSSECGTQIGTNNDRLLTGSVSNDTNSADSSNLQTSSCDPQTDNAGQCTATQSRSAQVSPLPNFPTERSNVSNVGAVQSNLDPLPSDTSVSVNVRQECLSSLPQNRSSRLPPYEQHIHTDEARCTQRVNYEYPSQQSRRSQSERRRSERERSREHFRRSNEHNYYEEPVSNDHREHHHRRHGLCRSNASELPSPGFDGETDSLNRQITSPSNNLEPVRSADGGIFVRHLSDGAQLIYIPAPNLPGYIEDSPPPYRENEY